MMQKLLAGAFAIILYLAFVAPSAHAVTEGRIPLTALVARAQEIVIGSVYDLTSMERFIGDYARVVTEVTLVDVEIVKGETADSELVVTQFGGRVGDVMEWYPGLPILEAEHRYLVFLVRNDFDLAFPIGTQGLFVIEVDSARGVEVVTAANGQPVLGLDGDFVEVGAGVHENAEDKTRLSEAMTLRAFLDHIEARMK
jgi:hypothetical protein